MPIYPYLCNECGNYYEEIHKFEDHSSGCKHCGAIENQKRQLGLPQTPKINGSDPGEKWGYNKTTIETNYGGDGRTWVNQYDHKKRESQIKEAKAKADKKGATVAVTKPSNKKSK